MDSSSKKLQPMAIRKIALSGNFESVDEIFTFINNNVLTWNSPQKEIKAVKEKLESLHGFTFKMIYIKRKVTNEVTKVTNTFVDAQLQNLQLDESSEEDDNEEEEEDDNEEEEEEDNEDCSSTNSTDIRTDVIMVFIKNNSGEPTVFIVSSGHAWRCINPKYIDCDFPNIVARRLLKFEVKNLTTHNLTGSAITVAKTYRQGHEEQPSLWSFLGCMKVSYTMPLKEQCRLYNLHCFKTSTGRHKRINVLIGKKQLKFKIKLDINCLAELLNSLKDIVYNPAEGEEDDPRFLVFEHVQVIKEKASIEELNKKLVQKLNSRRWENLQLTYKNVAMWEEVTLSFKEGPRKYRQLKSLENQPLLEKVLDFITDLFEKVKLDFSANIQDVFIKFKHQGNTFTEPLLNFIEGPILTVSGKSVFRHGGRWMRISCEYMVMLEEEFAKFEITSTAPHDVLPLPWPNSGRDNGNKCNRSIFQDWLKMWPDQAKRVKHVLGRASEQQTEGDYNEGYYYYDEIVRSKIKDTGYLLGDRVLVKNVELFDILHYTPNRLYLIHVKEGFGTSTRDVCSQIRVAAELLFRHFVSDSSVNILKKFYTAVQSNCESNYRKLVRNMYKSFEDFQKLFTQRQIIFVLAYRDTKQNKEQEPKIGTSIQNLQNTFQEKFGDKTKEIIFFLQKGCYLRALFRDKKVSFSNLTTTDKVFLSTSDAKKDMKMLLEEHLGSPHRNADKILNMLVHAFSLLKGMLAKHESVLAKMEIVQLRYHFEKCYNPRFSLQILNISK